MYVNQSVTCEVRSTDRTIRWTYVKQNISHEPFKKWHWLGQTISYPTNPPCFDSRSTSSSIDKFVHFVFEMMSSPNFGIGPTVIKHWKDCEFELFHHRSLSHSAVFTADGPFQNHCTLGVQRMKELKNEFITIIVHRSVEEQTFWPLPFSMSYTVQYKGWISKGNREWTHTRNTIWLYKRVFSTMQVRQKMTIQSPLFIVQCHISQGFQPNGWRVFRTPITQM